MNKSLEPNRSEAPQRSGEKQVDPAVKVPAMVKKYMESNPVQGEKEEQQNL